MEYFATLTHPNDSAGRWSGEHAFRVSETTDENGRKVFYAVARNFGCGRYATTPERAIHSLANASASTVTGIRRA